MARNHTRYLHISHTHYNVTSVILTECPLHRSNVLAMREEQNYEQSSQCSLIIRVNVQVAVDVHPVPS